MKAISRTCLILIILISQFLISSFTNNNLLFADKLIEVKENWEFYWNQLLTPDDFIKTTHTPSAIISIPHIWNNLSLNNKKISAYGFATYRKIIKIENLQHQIYGIRTEKAYTAYQIWINGKLTGKNGTVAKTRDKMLPAQFSEDILFTPETGTVEIIIQVSNFFHNTGGLRGKIYYGKYQDIIHFRLLDVGKKLISLGIILIISIYNLGIFFFRKKENHTLYFSIYCLIIAFRQLCSDNYLFSYIYPAINWEFLMKCNYLTVFTSTAVFIFFIHSLYNYKYNKPIITFYIIISTIYTIITIIFPVRIYSSLIVYYHILLILGCLYVIYILSISAMHKKEGAIMILIGCIALFMTLINDILSVNNIIYTPLIYPYGMFFFILIQAIVLSRKFSNAYFQVERLSNKLERYSNVLENEVKKRTKQLKTIYEQKTNIFINLAHETKTPLTLISNYLDKYIKENKFNQDLAIVKHNLDKLKTDVTSYLDVEKLEKGQLLYKHNQIIDLSNLIEKKILLFKLHAEKKKIDIIKEIADNIYIKANPGAIDRILNNLLNNAIIYTNDAGLISIKLSIQDNKIVIIIKDNGIGIADEEIDKIFLPYYQAAQIKHNIQGMGVGLYIVKKIINSLNGIINVTSQLDKGTQFEIILNQHKLKENEIVSDYKIQNSTISLNNIKKNKMNFDQDKQTILIVDDNATMLNYLIGELADEYNLFTAINGVDAIKKLEDIPAIDIIISDIMMDQMDGFEFYKYLINNKQHNNIPFIFLTARNSVQERISNLNKGVTDYIYKPFSITELKAKITSILINREKQRKLNFNEAINVLTRQAEQTKETSDYEQNIFLNNCQQFDFTKRETEIAELILNGMDTKKISNKLSIAIKTVDKHLQNIFQKASVHNRLELRNILSGNLDKEKN